MPAVRHAFTDNPLPAIVVADSSFIFEALIDSGQGKHAPARAFANRLIQANCLLLYSSLLFLEAPQCWRRLHRRRVLASSQRGIDPAMDRVNVFNEANTKLEQFLASFHCNRINVTVSLMRSTSAFAASYDLNSYDALIVAILRNLGISNLIAIDRDFRSIVQ